MVNITRNRDPQTGHIIGTYHGRIFHVTEEFLEDVEAEKKISPERAIIIILNAKTDAIEPVQIKTEDFRYL